MSLQEDNSGLFWATKFNVTRIGHGGSDPGLKTEMLADLSREVGVILFTNTSLSDQEMRHYVAIFLELWKHAEALKDEEQRVTRGKWMRLACVCIRSRARWLDAFAVDVEENFRMISRFGEGCAMEV